MTGAFVDGIRRVAAAPALLLGTGAFALPVVFLSGIFPWRSVHHLASNPPPNAFEAAVPLACAAAWAFLTGGVIERLARQRRVGGAGFFTACGVHVWRLIRLAVLAGVVHALLRGALHPWLLDAVLDALHRRPDGVLPETAVRRTLAGLTGALAAGVTVVFDYARVRTVVEDRRSTIGALLAAGRFVRRRPAAVAGLWLLNAALAGIVLAAHDLAAPDPGARNVAGVPDRTGPRRRATLRGAGGPRLPDGVLPGAAGPRHLRRAGQGSAARTRFRPARLTAPRRGAPRSARVWYKWDVSACRGDRPCMRFRNSS